jgi:hypothetical protein
MLFCESLKVKHPGGNGSSRHEVPGGDVKRPCTTCEILQNPRVEHLPGEWSYLNLHIGVFRHEVLGKLMECIGVIRRGPDDEVHRPGDRDKKEHQNNRKTSHYPLSHLFSSSFEGM